MPFQIVQSAHIMDGYAIVPTYGFIMTTPDDYKVYWTSDMQFNPNQIMDFYKKADTIIQDCETLPFKSGVHAHFDDIATLPLDIREKMLLVHYHRNSTMASHLPLRYSRKRQKPWNWATKSEIVKAQAYYSGQKSMINFRKEEKPNLIKYSRYDRVAYIPNHADGLDHPDTEIGYVSSINEKYIFVKMDKYLQNSPWDDVTAHACLPRNLRKLSGSWID